MVSASVQDRYSQRSYETKKGAGTESDITQDNRLKINENNSTAIQPHQVVEFPILSLELLPERLEADAEAADRGWKSAEVKEAREGDKIETRRRSRKR